MNNITLVIIFVLLAVWIAIIVSRICMTVEKCAVYRCVAFYLNEVSASNNNNNTNLSNVMQTIANMTKSVDSAANGKKTGE